jgi:hypothetical protein
MDAPRLLPVIVSLTEADDEMVPIVVNTNSLPTIGTLLSVVANVVISPLARDDPAITGAIVANIDLSEICKV